MANKTKTLQRLGLLWLAGALITWTLAQAREVRSGRTQGEGVTFEIHAIERMPLYLMGWPLWLYWRVADIAKKNNFRIAKPQANAVGWLAVHSAIRTKLLVKATRSTIKVSIKTKPHMPV